MTTQYRRRMSAAFKPGDRVYVDDPGLEALRDIMARATGRPAPDNHRGTVSDEEWDDDATVLINFDDGIGAPYPVGDVHHEGESG